MTSIEIRCMDKPLKKLAACIFNQGIRGGTLGSGCLESGGKRRLIRGLRKMQRAEARAVENEIGKTMLTEVCQK